MTALAGTVDETKNLSNYLTTMVDSMADTVNSPRSPVVQKTVAPRPVDVPKAMMRNMAFGKASNIMYHARNVVLSDKKRPLLNAIWKWRSQWMSAFVAEGKAAKAKLENMEKLEEEARLEAERIEKAAADIADLVATKEAEAAANAVEAKRLAQLEEGLADVLAKGEAAKAQVERLEKREKARTVNVAASEQKRSALEPGRVAAPESEQEKASSLKSLIILPFLTLTLTLTSETVFHRGLTHNPTLPQTLLDCAHFGDHPDGSAGAGTGGLLPSGRWRRRRHRSDRDGRHSRGGVDG